MASIKDLKKRIFSVKNTQQTTKAMKMVSAAKLRRSQNAIGAMRPYADGLVQMAKKLEGSLPPGFQSVYSRKSLEKPRVRIGIFGSDRGLCGGFNSNLNKYVQKWLKENSDHYESIEFVVYGKKPLQGLLKTKFKDQVVVQAEAFVKGDHRSVRRLTEELLKPFEENKVDEVRLFFTEFQNAISQSPKTEKLLPLESHEVQEDQTKSIVKPSVEVLVESLMADTLKASLQKAVLETIASEHGARMAAMDSATRNCGELIRSLTLQFNKQRQASITKELLEITAGVEAQK